MTSITREKVDKIVKEIQKNDNLQERRMLLFNLSQLLPGADQKIVEGMLPLLNDWDFEIRQETAFWFETFQIPLSKENQRLKLYALLQFETLRFFPNSYQDERKYLLYAMKDRNLRVREKVFRVFHLNDCQTDQERLLYWYGRGDYTEFLKLARESDLQERAKEILREGLSDKYNIPYHQRQCAFALRQLGEEVAVPGKPKTTFSEPEDEAVFTDKKQSEQIKSSPLELFLQELNESGILTRNGLIHPNIHIVSRTGRITYKNPGIQNWSEDKKISEIVPPDGRVIWRFDFSQIEPRLLLHFLVQRFWLSISDLPEEDVYDWLGLTNRQEAKKCMNKLINGGNISISENTSSKFKKFKNALNNYRLELLEEGKQENFIETITGRRISIDMDANNLMGKIVNYKIQGSAADYFNEAVVSLHAFIRMEELPAQIILLIYDEVWIAIDKQNQDEIVSTISSFLELMAKKFQLFLSIPVHTKKIIGEDKK